MILPKNKFFPARKSKVDVKISTLQDHTNNNFLVVVLSLRA